MKVLTQVARTGGAPAVIAELASRLDGWAVLLDSHGQPITSAGAGALHVRDAAAVALRRPIRVRHPGLEAFPVGAGEDLSAYLVISSRAGSTSRNRDLASQASALLDLILRTHDSSTTERLGRDALFGTLLGEPPQPAAALLRRWGVREESLAGLVVSARTKSVDVERLVSRWFDDLGWPHILTAEQGRIVALLRADRVDDFTERLSSFAVAAVVPLRCGVGAPAGVDALGRTVAEARQANDVALAEGTTVARYAALPTVRYVLDRLDGDDLRGVTGLLAPLREDDGRHGVLTNTLQVFLGEHGSWGVSARRLGVHRQTLAARVRRIEELTGLSMTNPDDRAAAWIALRALDRAAV
jgi:purine catabolism regulator